MGTGVRRCSLGPHGTGEEYLVAVPRGTEISNLFRVCRFEQSDARSGSIARQCLAECQIDPIRLLESFVAFSQYCVHLSAGPERMGSGSDRSNTGDACLFGRIGAGTMISSGS